MADPLAVLNQVKRLRKLREERRARRRKAESSHSLAELALDTESLLTGPFGLTTATPCQRAAARILDGLPLGDLLYDPEVQQFIGAVNGEIDGRLIDGHLWQEVVFLAAVRGAKTFLACAAAVRMSQTVDTSKLTHGEVPRISIVSRSLSLAGVAYGYLRAAFEQTELRSLLLEEPTRSSFTIRGANGWPIEIATKAGAKAGASLVATWSAGAIFDEAPRMAAKDEGVVNLADARTAILGRLLPGAQALYIGSPWAPNGLVYDLVEEFWQQPGKNLVVLRGTGPMLNPSWWTPARCDDLRERDPLAYQTDVKGEFANPESGLLDPGLVTKLTREGPLELPYEWGGTYSAACDPSEGGEGGNGFTLVIVQRKYRDDGQAIYPVAFAREWRGQRPAKIWEEIAAACDAYGLNEAATDQYAASANADLAIQHGLTLEVDPSTGPKNVEDFTNFATLARQELIEFPPDPQFKKDLLNISKRVTQNSVAIVLPKTADGRHCDFAPALVKALKGAVTSNTPMMEAMRERLRRRTAANG